jgi:RNA polymerase sigma-70 factor (ECF subfamily)
MSDARLVDAIADGDHNALALAYVRYYARVHGLATRMCGRIGADDVVQEVFVGLWHRPGRYDPSRGSLPSFLVVQTHGRAVDWLRSDSSRQARESAAFARRTPTASAVDDAAVARLVGDEVARVLAALPAHKRDPIVLAYFGGHTYREVAAFLERPEATVKSQIRSGLALLRSLLGEFHPSAALAP